MGLMRQMKSCLTHTSEHYMLLCFGIYSLVLALYRGFWDIFKTVDLLLVVALIKIVLDIVGFLKSLTVE